jgi:hypothetical protein
MSNFQISTTTKQVSTTQCYDIPSYTWQGITKEMIENQIQNYFIYLARFVSICVAKSFLERLQLTAVAYFPYENRISCGLG